MARYFKYRSPVELIADAARLGLEIGGPLGHFHLVPFRNSKLGVKGVTPILGYKGMIVLARRSGEISSIAARPWRWVLSPWLGGEGDGDGLSAQAIAAAPRPRTPMTATGSMQKSWVTIRPPTSPC